MSTKDAILEVINKTSALPFLFIGSGLSRRYLGLPDWESMLRKYADMCYTPSTPLAYESIRDSKEVIELIENYNQEFKVNKIPELACIAQKIEIDFITNWYANIKQGLEISPEIINLVQSGVNPFKATVAQETSSLEIVKTPQMEKEIKILKKLAETKIAGVITTNYDQLTDYLYPNFENFVGQDELFFKQPEYIGEIYQIHGCCNRPESIILTAKDYRKFYEKNPILIAKLMVIFAEHPIIFLGYSISDPIIQSIITDIYSNMPKDKIDLLKNNLIFVEYDNTKTDTKTNTVFEHSMQVHDFIIPMKKFILNDYSILYEALLEHHVTNTYDIRILRKLRNDVYKLVANTSISDAIQINVSILDDNPNITPEELENMPLIIGVGKQKEYHTLTGAEIYLDLIKEYINISDYKDFVFNILEPTMKHYRPIPIYKYLSKIPEIEYDDLPQLIKNQVETNTSFNSFFSSAVNSSREKNENININININDLLKMNNNDYKKTAMHIGYLPKESIFNSNDLESFIKDFFDNIEHPFECSAKTEIRRLIRLYDWHIYSQDFWGKVKKRPQ